MYTEILSFSSLLAGFFRIDRTNINEYEPCIRGNKHIRLFIKLHFSVYRDNYRDNYARNLTRWQQQAEDCSRQISTLLALDKEKGRKSLALALEIQILKPEDTTLPDFERIIESIIKSLNDRLTGFSISAGRELLKEPYSFLKSLRILKHPRLIHASEIIFDSRYTGRIKLLSQ